MKLLSVLWLLCAGIILYFLFTGFVVKNNTAWTDEEINEVQEFVKFELYKTKRIAIVVHDVKGKLHEPTGQRYFEKRNGKKVLGTHYMGYIIVVRGRKDILAHEIGHLYGCKKRDCERLAESWRMDYE